MRVRSPQVVQQRAEDTKDDLLCEENQGLSGMGADEPIGTAATMKTSMPAEAMQTWSYRVRLPVADVP